MTEDSRAFHPEAESAPTSADFAGETPGPPGSPCPTGPPGSPCPTGPPAQADIADMPDMVAPPAQADVPDMADLADTADVPDIADLADTADTAGIAPPPHESVDIAPGFDAPPQTPPAPSGRALGIRMRKAGQVVFFPNTEHTVRIGTKVLVETELGPALGEVDAIFHGKLPPAMDDGGENNRIIGLATAQDIAQHTENAILAAEASAFCKTCIRQRGLDMKLVDVEVLHDRSKIIFFFTAPSRIDFRELVKDLVRNYRTRIELRQIGVRHEAQMLGGLGNCGSVCCCHTYLRKFAPVTIKMAKEQNLFLNPAKLSGMCGRLLCCLSFEQGNYEEFNRRCPKLGKKYETTQGTVKILRANMFSQSIVILGDSGEEAEIPLDEWEAREPRRAEPAPHEQQKPGGQRGGEGSHKHRPRGGAHGAKHHHEGPPHDDTPDGRAKFSHDRPAKPRKRRRTHEE